ncbi:hypothetical protein GCM10027270_23590 [Nocardioides ginkgobilobae]|uniref:Unannotated protein n=1 Tax=freshwater metagenome TaxID=449393 RepID=A0A6J6RWN2_9ZZZZ|nr:twin-arginine translocase TatA/TatE family subunit [Actinomycetota bacterium]
MYSLIAMPQGAEWLVILAIVILVFGAAKLPDLARGTGQALRIFKAETKGLKDDDKDDEGPAAPAELPPTSLAEETKADSPIVGEPHPDQRG